jgi:pentatricopeptide repeat protein
VLLLASVLTCRGSSDASELIESGSVPKSPSFWAPLLNSCVRTRNAELAFQLLGLMLDCGIQPDLLTCVLFRVVGR